MREGIRVLRTSTVALSLMVGAAGASVARRDGRLSSPEARERVGRKACLAHDAAKGVGILSDLHRETDDPTCLFNQGRCCASGSVCAACGTRLAVCSNQCVDLRTDNPHGGSCTGTGSTCIGTHQCKGGVRLKAAGVSCIADAECAAAKCARLYVGNDTDGYPDSSNSPGWQIEKEHMPGRGQCAFDASQVCGLSTTAPLGSCGARHFFQSCQATTRATPPVCTNPSASLGDLVRNH
jgi:hypothetical protein